MIMNEQDEQNLFNFHVYNYLFMRGLPNLANSFATAANLTWEPVDGGILAVYFPQGNRTLVLPEHLRRQQNVPQTGQSSANRAMQTNISTALPTRGFRAFSTPMGSGSHFPTGSNARTVQEQPASNLLGKRTRVQGHSSSTSSIAAQPSVPQEMDSPFVLRFDSHVHNYLILRGMLNLAYSFTTEAKFKPLPVDMTFLAVYWPQSNTTLVLPEHLRRQQNVPQTGQSSANRAMQTNISTAMPSATRNSTTTRGNFGGSEGQGQLISTLTGSGSHFPSGTDARMIQEQPASNILGKRTRGQSESSCISNTAAQYYVPQEMDSARSSRLSMQQTSREPPPGITCLSQLTNSGTDLQMGPKPSMQETSIKLPPGGTYIREWRTNSGTDSKKGQIPPTEHIFKVPPTPSARAVASLPKQETSDAGRNMKTDLTPGAPTDSSHPKSKTSDEGSPSK